MLQRMDPPKCSVTYAKSIGRSVYFRKFSFQHFSTAFFNITLTPKLNIISCMTSKQNDSYLSSSLFTRPCAMLLFPVPSYEMPDERETFC